MGLMFKIGDKVFYPLHGVGYLSGIEELRINANFKVYYKIYITDQKLFIYVPKEKAQKLGLRLISSVTKLRSISQRPYDHKKNLTLSYFERTSSLKEQLRLGRCEDLIQLARDSRYAMNKKIKLSREEHDIFKTANTLLEQEIMMIEGVSSQVAREFIENDFKKISERTI